MHNHYKVRTDGINAFEQIEFRKTETCFIFYSHKGIKCSDSVFLRWEKVTKFYFGQGSSAYFARFNFTAMAETNDRSVCGVPYLPVPNNDTISFIHEVAVSAVNVPCCIFAFLGNLAVIVAVIKTPSLQTPCNILLCSLCVTDCLTGLIAQPMFVTWRLVIHRIHESCDYQAEVYKAFSVCLKACSGWSFVNLCLISIDRHYALAKPLVYRSRVTKKGKCYK